MLSITYGKTQEIDADISGINFAQQKNGHIGCALDFFTKKNTTLDNITEIFSSHPMTKTRIQKLETYIEDN